MKRVAFGLAILLIFLLPTVALAGDGAQLRKTNFALGYNLNNFRHDFGFGLNATSSYFWHDRAAVRFSANNMYFEGIPAGETESTWMPYTVYKLGLIGVAAVVNDLVRLYGEGGFMYIVPNGSFSDNSKLGGYGHFGFEFFMDQNAPYCYFIELGSVGTVARAEKLTGKPIYGSGFAIAVGLRYHL
ncbi:MAG: hypothetical protein GX085_00845 [Firmicutes bacterium]|nr:hypothetical protein [Bacillota bacterium]